MFCVEELPEGFVVFLGFRGVGFPVAHSWGGGWFLFCLELEIDVEMILRANITEGGLRCTESNSTTHGEQ